MACIAGGPQLIGWQKDNAKYRRSTIAIVNLMQVFCLLRRYCFHAVSVRHCLPSASTSMPASCRSPVPQSRRLSPVSCSPHGRSLNGQCVACLSTAASRALALWTPAVLCSLQ